MFTLDPNTGIDVWAPILIAVATWAVHVPPLDWCIVGRSWAAYSLWYIFVGIFGNFGYAGNWGVISGYFACGVAALCLVVNFTGEPDPPSSFSVVRELYYLRRERILRKREQRRLKHEQSNSANKVDSVADEVGSVHDIESGIQNKSSKKKKEKNDRRRHRNRGDDDDDNRRNSSNPYEGGWLCYPCWSCYHSTDFSCFGNAFQCFGNGLKSCFKNLCRNPFKLLNCSCSMHTRTGVAIVRLLSAVASFLTIVVGIVHVSNTFQEWCDEDEEQGTICAGPFLMWNGDGTDFFAPSNQGLRSVVGLAPGVFLELLAPLIFGFIGMACHFKRTGMYRVVRNWSAMICMHIFTATFANFGYTGNWGIVVGFLSCGVAVLAVLVIITDNAHHGPFVEREVRNGGVGAGKRRRSTFHTHGHGHAHGHTSNNNTSNGRVSQSSGETDESSESSSMHTAESTRRPSRTSGGRSKSRSGRGEGSRGKSKSSRRDRDGGGGGDSGGNFLGNWLENVKNSATGAMSPRGRDHSRGHKHDRHEGGERSKSKSRDDKGRSKSASRSRSHH
jgi:hypothetical protein